MPLPGNPRIHNRQQIAHHSPKGDALGALGISEGELTSMAKQLSPGGGLVLPGWPNYDVARQGNPLYPAHPTIIVNAGSEADVGVALGWSRLNGWPLTVRSGGHSTAGYSLSDGMILDVSGLNAVEITASTKQMTVGSGANWGTINAALDQQGLHVVGGGCPTVGVAGYMQGGGYGFTARRYGMNCDQVLAFRMMKADGTVVTANATGADKELFWAVRGGTGGNFGVLLDITFQLVALKNVWGFALRWPIDQAAAALVAVQEGWTGTQGDPKIGYQAVLTLSEDPTTKICAQSFVMLGMYDGSQADGKQAIATLLGTGSPQYLLDEMSTYQQLNEGLINVLPGVPEDPGETTYELKRCGYVATSLEAGDWQTILDAYAESPNDYNIVGIEPYGGAIAKPKSPNAFVHRNPSMNVFVDSFYSEAWDANGANAAQRWLDTMMGALADFTNGEVYQNYPWRTLPDWQDAYWPGVYPRLQAAKAAYDPTCFFRFEQGITPANGCAGDAA